jgi:presenilin-like A22 family membrane protease
MIFINNKMQFGRKYQRPEYFTNTRGLSLPTAKKDDEERDLPESEDTDEITEDDEEVEKAEESSEKPKPKTKSKEPAEPPKPAPMGPIIIIGLLFVVSIGFALFLAPIYGTLGLRADFSELGGEESLLIPLFYVVVILVFTAAILFYTRKRKGTLIKYAFLGVICLSMMYVFFALFVYALFPVDTQEWSGEVEIDGKVTTILIADLVGNADEEIIVGLEDGHVMVYNDEYKLLTQTPEPITGSVRDIGVTNRRFMKEDTESPEQKVLVVFGSDLKIFEPTSTNGSYTLNLAPLDDPVVPNKTYVSMEHIIIIGQTSAYSKIFLSSNDPMGNGHLERLIYFNGSYELIDFINLSYRINSVVTGISFEDDLDSIIFIGTSNGVYSIDSKKPRKSERKVINTTHAVVDISIHDVDSKGNSELVILDDTGVITIYDNYEKEYSVDDFRDKHIGGVTFHEIFSGNDDLEMVVSSGGKVIIYYSYEKFLDETFEFTEDTGELDDHANGIAISDLDGNSEPDIVLGNSNGFKSYQYSPVSIPDMPCIMGLIVSIILTVVLFYYPEWYLVDIVGIIVAGGVAALIGISIGLLPILVLLIILAVYDAISVYKTKHMVSLADKVMEFRLPILLVVPKKRGYSFLRQKGLRKQLEEGEEREAMFMGLGDIIIPGCLVISAFTFLSDTPVIFGLGANLIVALFTLVGMLFGYSALMQYVIKGNPQAGLPLLNTGAILGFFISNYIVYQDITFGLTLPIG